MNPSQNQLKPNPCSFHAHAHADHHRHLLICRHYHHHLLHQQLLLHHHHHHHRCQFPPHCEIHNRSLPPIGRPLLYCPSFIPPQNVLPPTSGSSQSNTNFVAPGYEQIHRSLTENSPEEVDYDEFGEEADEEPVFVLTDEWAEFFAKSEARRREAKNQAKKQGKN